MSRTGWSASAAKDAAKALARRAGLDVRRHVPRSSPDARRAALLEREGVTLVVDAGANRGQFAAALRSAGYRGRIVSFEPVAEPYGELAARAAADPLWEVHRLALAEAAGSQAINVTASTASSSLLEAAPGGFDVPASTRVVGSERVTLARLDDVLAAAGDEVAYLKADVQGYELAVLAGAPQLLERARAVELELSLVPLYRGQPLWREVLDAVEAAGFELFSLTPAFSDLTTGRLLQVDAVCVREP